MIISCAPKKTSDHLLVQYMDAEAAINDFAGTVIVTRNDSILLKKAYGLADYEWEVKNTIDTKFSLASVSKQFTAVAILQLAETGRLHLDDKLVAYYPTFPKGDQISIKMLLSHNSGIGNGPHEVFNSNASISSDSLVQLIMKEPLLFEPGTGTSYSNTAYYLLATLIEKTSGLSYANYLQKHLFDTASMNHSGVSSNDSIFHKMAKSYYTKEGTLIKNPYGNTNFNIGMDGVYATVEDLYVWNKELFDNTNLLSEASKEKMFTSYNKESFGYGVLVNPFYNHGHNLIGHDGGYYGVQTSFNKFPDEQLFVTVLSNNGSPSYLIAHALSAVALGIPVEFPYKHIPVAINSEVFSQYVGEYDGVKIHQKENKLWYSDYDIELIPESETKFFRSDNSNRTIEFIKNKEGKVHQIEIITHGVKKVKDKDA